MCTGQGPLWPYVQIRISNTCPPSLALRRSRRVEIPGPDLLRKDRVIEMLPQYRHFAYSLLPPRRAKAGRNNFQILQIQMTKTFLLMTAKLLLSIGKPALWNAGYGGPPSEDSTG